MSPTVVAAVASACVSSNSNTNTNCHFEHHSIPFLSTLPQVALSRYESQKRGEWNMFVQYLKKQYDPPLAISRCSEAHVVEFLKYFGDTLYLDALIGRLRAAFEESI
ncbi:hypothetical protein PTKIN_Ptkin18bG0014800 [Pterospermum kingtungense]